MSQIRHHLKSSEKHRRFFSVLRHCERCHEDVVEKPRDDGVTDQAWTDGNHATGTCTKRDEARESLVVCWARLYLAIFPTETSVPSPCKCASQSKDYMYFSKHEDHNVLTPRP